MQAQALRQRAVEGDSQSDSQRSAQLISQSLDLLTSSLAAQQESVGYVAEAAEASLENVRSGNRELVEAVKRPSTLRDFSVAFLLALWVLLLVLDFYN